MAEFRLGERVRLKPYYLRAIKKEVKHHFSGELVVIAISGGTIRLSKKLGSHDSYKLTCSANSVEKINQQDSFKSRA